jgi:hypothetical protein
MRFGQLCHSYGPHLAGLLKLGRAEFKPAAHCLERRHVRLPGLVHLTTLTVGFPSAREANQEEILNRPVAAPLGGSARPNVRFQELCEIAGIKPRTNAQTGKEEPWLLKDLRKTCATYYDAHVPESSIEILGHSVGGITYRHYAHRAPLAFKAIMTLPQPTAFSPP